MSSWVFHSAVADMVAVCCDFPWSPNMTKAPIGSVQTWHTLKMSRILSVAWVSKVEESSSQFAGDMLKCLRVRTSDRADFCH